MAEHRELYRLAHYYDVVFDRDVGPEIDFLTDLYRELRGRSPWALLDIACGPGYHAREWARCGRRAVGLDLRPEMVAYAREQAERRALTVDWRVGDMREFVLPEPVDLALSAFDSVDCLLTNDDLLAHLRAVARNLAPGGLYVIDLTHPRDCSPTGYRDFHYHGERDGCRVRIDWAVNAPVPDPLSQTVDVEVHMHVEEDGRRETIVSRARERMISAQEIVALAEQSGRLRVRDWYGAYDRRQPFDASSAAGRMIAVLELVEPTGGWALDRPTNWVSPKLEVRSRPGGGRGLVAREAIERDEVVTVWGGEIADWPAVMTLTERERRLTVQVDEGLYLVPTRPFDPGDFMNHSCAPNAGMRGQIAVVAMRPITAGDEVCIDYAMTDATPFAEFACSCGADGCRGRFRADDWRRPELWARYAGYFTPYLARRIAALERPD